MFVMQCHLKFEISNARKLVDNNIVSYDTLVYSDNFHGHSMFFIKLTYNKSAYNNDSFYYKLVYNYNFPPFFLSEYMVVSVNFEIYKTL